MDYLPFVMVKRPAQFNKITLQFSTIHSDWSRIGICIQVLISEKPYISRGGPAGLEQIVPKFSPDGAEFILSIMSQKFPKNKVGGGEWKVFVLLYTFSHL